MYLAEIDWITLVQWYSPFQHFQLSLRLVFFYSNQNFPARRFLRERRVVEGASFSKESF